MTHDASDQHGTARPARWILRTLIVLLIVGASGALGTLGWVVYNSKRYYWERDALNQAVGQWERCCPAGIDPQAWENAVMFAQIAIGNTCFSPGHVPLDEVVKLRQEVEQKSIQPVGVETLDWLWQRLSTAGPGGAKYTAQMQPLWDENTAGIRPQPSPNDTTPSDAPLHDQGPTE